MELLNEIRDAFASINPGKARELNSLDSGWPAWVLKSDEGYGVAVPFDDFIPISEHFSNARIWSTKKILDGNEKALLMLTSTEESLRNEFASVCAQFVDPGKDGTEREWLCKDPYQWWGRWKRLLGNAIKENPSYSVLGELLIYEKLLNDGRGPVWRGPDKASHDVETVQASYEVKSSIGRYSTYVTISGQHQLQPVTGKKLFLVFCRFEESPFGLSIDDVMQRIIVGGHDTAELESRLANLGFEPGSMARKENYYVLETRRYEIDDNFPRITAQSFVDGKIPDTVIQLTYSLDLSGISYQNWE